MTKNLRARIDELLVENKELVIALTLANEEIVHMKVKIERLEGQDIQFKIHFEDIANENRKLEIIKHFNAESVAAILRRGPIC